MRVLREVRKLECQGCPDGDGERTELHWPGHPHYDVLHERDRADDEEHDERQREDAAPEEHEPEEHEHAALPAAASHPDDEGAAAEAGAMEAHLRQFHGYAGDDIGVATGRADNVRGRRNSLNAAHKGDHASEGFEHWEQHPHPPITRNRRPDGGPPVPMADGLQTSIAEHRWRKSREAAASAVPSPVTRADNALGAREAAWDDPEADGNSSGEEWRDDDDEYVTCGRGHEHYGPHGAAGMLIRHHGDDGQDRYLLQRRSPNVQHGRTWSTPGGALARGEAPEEGAWREAEEELGTLPAGVTHHHTYTDDHGGWAYHTVVADSPHMFTPHGGHQGAGWESSGHRWVTAGEMRGLPLHPGFAASWEGVRKSGALDDEAAARRLREERGDRWHDFRNRPGDDLHRGIHVQLPEDVHEYVHDESVPRHDRARRSPGALLLRGPRHALDPPR